ncbi:hypothetical protein CTA1_7396 [Colletotrichum tanaceti]|uniref:Uncharacterized protein n=1 Tax=Colletotrichum tanaceti TaxID=1306861 RepID=A0A4U6XUE9_9PEZI|nr:hypothetical protein CTA1_7396 [Colletotrichum tanaceti]
MDTQVRIGTAEWCAAKYVLFLSQCQDIFYLGIPCDSGTLPTHFDTDADTDAVAGSSLGISDK